MDLFLQETKNKLINLSTYEKIHVVIGNEACDLDSTVSALVYAYFLNETKRSTENVFIPVLDIPRKQFRLRTEVTYFLHRLGIDETHLTFQDDIDLHDLHSQGKLSLTLVDHNLLLQKQADLDSCVVEVIDHRSNQRGDGDDNCPVTIEMVGSCATLITEKIVNTDASVLTEEVSTLLIGTILLDTVNFDPAVGKTTSKDVAMVEQLTEQFPSLDKNELYESLQSAKCDLSGLDPKEILLKDLKCLSNDVIKLGFSSITLHLKKFLQNDNIIEDFKSFCASHDIDILVILAISIDEGTTTRQLAIYAHRHDNIKNDIIFKLECSITPDLDLSPMVTSFEEITAYYQGNITASRKKVLPIFTEFLENMNTDTVREKDTVPSSSDLMDLDSDTLSAKSSGLSELTSEPSTTANTPSSPQKSVDLLGLDPFAPAPSTQPNDNANNNADQDPFGALDTQLPPEILSPTGASDDSGFDPLVDVSPMSRTPDLISVSASSNVNNTFSTGQATWQQPDLFGVDDLPLKSQPEVDLFDPLGLGEVTSSDAQNIQAGTQDESNLIEVETQQKSLPVPIPSKLETGNETTQSPLIPLTPQNSYGSLSDAELSEIGDTKQRSVDLSNPDIAYAVHERLREVEEDENFHNFYSDVDNESSDKVDGDNKEGLVFTTKEESTSDMTHNEVANMMASDMTAEISTEHHTITDSSEDSGRTAVDSLSDGQATDENLNPTETIRNSGHNVIAEAISEDMAESRKEIVFPKKDVTKYEYNTVAKEIAQDMTTETEKISFANKNLTEFEHNVIADEIALDMAKSGEEIIFVKKDLTNFESNVIAEEFANSMATRGHAVTFAKKDLTEYRQNVIAHEIAELMAENRQGITFAKKDLTEYRHNAIAHEIAEHMVENRQGITFAKKDLTEYRHNVIAHEIAEHMLENRQGITFAKKDMTDLENNIIATEISENMAKEENLNESDRGEIESKSVTDISELQKIEFANKGSAFTDEQLKQNEVAKMIANDLYKDSMGQDYEINKVNSVSENEEVDKFSKRFDQDLQNEIDFELTVTKPAISRDNNVAEMIADDMDIDDHKRTTNFPEKAIDLTSAKYNVVADAIAKDMRNGEYCDFRFSKRDLQLPSDNVVAKMFTEDMMNDADVDKELSMINQDLTYIEPSVRSTNIAAYMLAYTSIDETEGTIKGEGNTTPGDGDTVENGEHNSPNNDTPDDSTHPGVSESASNIMSEPFVPIDQPATSDPVTIADIEEHQGMLSSTVVNPFISDIFSPSEEQITAAAVGATNVNCGSKVTLNEYSNSSNERQKNLMLEDNPFLTDVFKPTELDILAAELNSVDMNRNVNSKDKNYQGKGLGLGLESVHTTGNPFVSDVFVPPPMQSNNTVPIMQSANSCMASVMQPLTYDPSPEIQPSPNSSRHPRPTSITWNSAPIIPPSSFSTALATQSKSLCNSPVQNVQLEPLPLSTTTLQPNPFLSTPSPTSPVGQGNPFSKITTYRPVRLSSIDTLAIKPAPHRKGLSFPEVVKSPERDGDILLQSMKVLSHIEKTKQPLRNCTTCCCHGNLGHECQGHDSHSAEDVATKTSVKSSRDENLSNGFKFRILEDVEYDEAQCPGIVKKDVRTSLLKCADEESRKLIVCEKNAAKNGIFENNAERSVVRDANEIEFHEKFGEGEADSDVTSKESSSLANSRKRFELNSFASEEFIKAASKFDSKGKSELSVSDEDGEDYGNMKNTEVTVQDNFQDHRSNKMRDNKDCVEMLKSGMKDIQSIGSFSIDYSDNDEKGLKNINGVKTVQEIKISCIDENDSLLKDINIHTNAESEKSVPLAWPENDSRDKSYIECSGRRNNDKNSVVDVNVCNTVCDNGGGVNGDGGGIVNNCGDGGGNCQSGVGVRVGSCTDNDTLTVSSSPLTDDDPSEMNLQHPAAAEANMNPSSSLIPVPSYTSSLSPSLFTQHPDHTSAESELHQSYLDQFEDLLDFSDSKKDNDAFSMENSAPPFLPVHPLQDEESALSPAEVSLLTLNDLTENQGKSTTPVEDIATSLTTVPVQLSQDLLDIQPNLPCTTETQQDELLLTETSTSVDDLLGLDMSVPIPQQTAQKSEKENLSSVGHNVDVGISPSQTAIADLLGDNDILADTTRPLYEMKDTNEGKQVPTENVPSNTTDREYLDKLPEAMHAEEDDDDDDSNRSCAGSSVGTSLSWSSGDEEDEDDDRVPDTPGDSVQIKDEGLHVNDGSGGSLDEITPVSDGTSVSDDDNIDDETAYKPENDGIITESEEIYVKMSESGQNEMQTVATEEVHQDNESESSVSFGSSVSEEEDEEEEECVDHPAVQDVITATKNLHEAVTMHVPGPEEDAFEEALELVNSEEVAFALIQEVMPPEQLSFVLVECPQLMQIEDGSRAESFTDAQPEVQEQQISAASASFGSDDVLPSENTTPDNSDEIICSEDQTEELEIEKNIDDAQDSTSVREGTDQKTHETVEYISQVEECGESFPTEIDDAESPTTQDENEGLTFDDESWEILEPAEEVDVSDEVAEECSIVKYEEPQEVDVSPWGIYPVAVDSGNMRGFEDSFVLPREEEESQSKAETKLMDDSHHLKDTAEGKLLVQSEPVEIVVSDEIDEMVVLAESDIPVPSVVVQSEEVMEEKTEEHMEETGSVVTEDPTPTDNLSKMSEEAEEDKKEFSESKLDENSESSNSSPMVENQQEQDEFIQIKEADEKEDVEDLLSLSVETEETMSPDPASMLPVLCHSADLGVHKVDEDICKHYEIPLAEQQLEVTYSKENSAMVSQEECEEEFIIISDDTPGVMEISVENEIIPEDVVEAEHEVKDDTKTPPDEVSAAPSQDTSLQVNPQRVASKSVEVFQEDVTEVQPEVRHATLPSTEETARELSEVLSQEPPVLKVSPHLQTASRNVEVLPEDVTEMRQEVTPENIPSSEVSVGKVSEVLSQEPPVLHVYPHPQVASRNVEVLPEDVTEMQQDLTPENIPSTEVPVGGISEAYSQEPPVLHVYPHPQIASKNVEVFSEDITETLQQATPENIPSLETQSHGVGEAVSHEPPVLQVNPQCSVASVTKEDSLAEDSTRMHTEIPGVTIPATQVSLDTVPQGTDQEPPVLQVSPDLMTTSEPDANVERQAGNESVSPQDPTPERAREADLQEKPSLQVYTEQEIVQELPVDLVTVKVPESEITDKPSSQADSSASSPAKSAESEPKALISPSRNISPAPTSSEVKPSQASLPNVSSNIDSKSPRESTAHTIHDPVTSTSERPPSDHSQLSFTSDVPKPPDKVVSSSTPGNSTLPASDGSSKQLTPHLTSVPNQPRSSEGLMTNRRVSSPSGDSESQTSGDEASTTSGSFSCSEIPSPVHHAITSITEIEEPVSETEEDVVTVEVVPEKPTSNGVIESDIMEEERVVIGQEDNSDKTRATEVKAPEIESVPNDKATTPDLDKDEYPARTVNDLDAAQKEAVARYMEKYIDEEEEVDLMSSMRIAENVAKASPRKKSVPQHSIEAEERMAGVNVKEEWQDDDDIMKHHADIGEDWLNDVIEIDITDPVPPRDDALTRPTSLDLGAKPKTRKKVSPPAELKITDNDDDRGSTPSDSFDLSRIDDLQTPDMRTPSLRDDSSILMTSGEMEWEDDTPLSKTTSSEKIPEYTAAEETKDNRHWRVVEIGGKNYNLDMKVIHPYKKVLSHGGYYGDGLNAIIVFAACYLPEKTRKDYNYVMDNLFLYVISTLDLLVAQDYMIIYFHGGCTKHQAPNLGWLKRCYKMIDRRLRKNLKALLLTHPNLWLKTVVRFSKPFISSKFSRKLRFVTSLEDLKQLTPLEYVYIPEQVKLFDDKKRKKKN